jgi:hypothetical protein
VESNWVYSALRLWHGLNLGIKIDFKGQFNYTLRKIITGTQMARKLGGTQSRFEHCEEEINPVAYLYKMVPVARIQIAPPLKYVKLCLSLLDLVSGT